MAFLANTRKGLICLQKPQSRIYEVSKTGDEAVRQNAAHRGACPEIFELHGLLLPAVAAGIEFGTTKATNLPAGGGGQVVVPSDHSGRT